MVAYNPDPILPQVRPGRSWDFANAVAWDCENRFEVKGNGDRDLQSGPDSVIDDEIGISRAACVVSRLLPWLAERISRCGANELLAAAQTDHREPRRAT